MLVCGCKEETDSYTSIIAIEDRVKRCADRIKHMLALQKKHNHDKKLALIVYNYPPGEENLADAAYLDSFESIRSILVKLRLEGYQVVDIPENMADLFLEKNIVNSPKWGGQHCGVLISREEYDQLMVSCPQLKSDIDQVWGDYPGKINVYQEQLRIPYLSFGNVYVMIQPSRGVHEDPKQSYHDKSLPPHHQYAVFYRWLQKNMDAVVHIGTHGTLEFLRGKELTISQNCDMDMLIGNLPHFYIYQVGNPSEAMTAKRRSLATLIGYRTPTADSTGLYGDYLIMMELFEERDEAQKLNPQRVTEIEKEIREKALNNDWADLKGDLSAIEGRLVALQRSLIPVGLHTFGKVMNPKEQLDFLTSVMRHDRNGLKSINRLIAEQEGCDYSSLLEKEAKGLVEYDQKAKDMILCWMQGGESAAEFEEHRSLTLKLLKDIAVDCELDSLVNALRGGYIEPGLAADPLKNPEVLPSGRNLYQFNPLSLPTASALERGSVIARNTLQLYFAENETYPKTTGVVLWGFETTKTCGETIGQVLEYLGVRIKSKPGSWFPGIEVIPADEMMHPRIDVMIQICGFFRDMFPNLVEILDDSVRIAGQLEEVDNVVYQQSKAICEKLILEGIEKETAKELAAMRIFGPKESEYGTSLTTMIETAAWQDECELGNAYERDMSYAYGRNTRGIKSEKLNQLLLSQVEMVSQVQDTYAYDVTDLDHYYEFFGGFSKAVENNRGIRPKMITTNTATEIIRTEDISAAISRGVASRTFNPKWVDALLEHDYHGAQKIANRVQYQIGLSATTDSVNQWVWDKTAQTFLFDEKMLDRLKENNIHAANEIAKRMYEAKQRGYWTATPEETEKLMQILMEFEEYLEGDN